MIVLVAMVSRKNFGVQLKRAKLFPRNSQDFVRCVFVVVGVYGLFKLK